MKMIGRGFSCVCAFLLALVVLGTWLGCFANHAVSSESFFKKPAQKMRGEQMERMESFVRQLSAQYGFDSSAVMEKVSAQTLDSYGDEVLGFLASLLEEQEEDTELIFPYYMSEDLLDTIRADEGFQTTVEKHLQRTVSQNEIVSPIEQEASRLVFPIRPQLVIAGYNMASERVSIPEAVRMIEEWWVLPIAGLVLMLLILLSDHPRFLAWTGSGLAAGSLMTGSLLLFLNALDASSAVAQINTLFARYLSSIWRNIWTTAAVYSGILLLIGIGLIICHFRSERKTL